MAEFKSKAHQFFYEWWKQTPGCPKLVVHDYEIYPVEVTVEARDEKHPLTFYKHYRANLVVFTVCLAGRIEELWGWAYQEYRGRNGEYEGRTIHMADTVVILPEFMVERIDNAVAKDMGFNNVPLMIINPGDKGNNSGKECYR